MRELSTVEIAAVAGGQKCRSPESRNNYGGVQNTKTFGSELIDLYEGAVAAVSHVIERVADAL